jgi:hypothetical protein
MELEMLQHLSRKVLAEVERLKDNLALGGAQDSLAAYTQMVGTIRGLHMANNIIMETAERYQGDD